MATIRVWVQLASQAQEEAIKLLLPSDGDVSDVLLQVPSALNVGSYRPSELSLHLIRDGVEDGTALSNRVSLSSLVGSEQRMELNVVVKPKDAPAKISPTRPTDAQPTTKAPAAPQRTAVVAHTATRRAASPAPKMPPVVPKAANTRLATSSPFRRTASTTSVSSGGVRQGMAPSTSTGVRASSPRASVAAPSPRLSAPRTTSAPRRGPSSEPDPNRMPRGAVSTASPLRKAMGTTARNAAPSPAPQQAKRTTPTRSRIASDAPTQGHAAAGASNRRPPTEDVAPARRASVGTPAATAPPSTARLDGRVAKPTTAPAARGPCHHPAQEQHPHPHPTLAAHGVPSSIGVCNAFKPQWGNVLCAACKHSKQAHLIQQKEARLQRANGRSSAVSSHADPSAAVSSDTSLLIDEPAHAGIVSPTHSYSAGMGRYNDNDVSLLDPPMVGNLSLGSPGNFSPE